MLATRGANPTDLRRNTTGTITAWLPEGEETETHYGDPELFRAVHDDGQLTFACRQTPACPAPHSSLPSVTPGDMEELESAQVLEALQRFSDHTRTKTPS